MAQNELPSHGWPAARRPVERRVSPRCPCLGPVDLLRSTSLRIDAFETERHRLQNRLVPIC